MSALRASSVLWVLSLAFGLHGFAAAGSWQTVIAGKTETIAIDKASIARADSGATAWSRITLDREVREAGGTYDSIQAQNLYDCTARRFTTLRRAYFNGDTLLREDVVSRQRANAVESGSIDERLFNLACRAAVGELPARADAATRAAAPAPQGEPAERVAAMRADMRTLATDHAAPRLMPVAETMPVVPAEKPKLIVLPPIDKAAADQAAAGSGQKPAATAPTAAAPLSPSAARSTAKHEAESSADKRLRELHYATSGPRKATKKKSTEIPAASEQENPAAHMHGHWTYEGAGGPTSWARLRGDYATCGTGKRQSPIDIREGIKVNLEGIKFDYKPTQFRIIDNGHTVQVNVGEGLGLTVMGKRHELLQFHFHRPSEERVNGRAYDMVVHLVHKNAEGQLAVVAVLLEKGSEHPLIQTLWNNLPLEQDMEVAPEEAIDLNKLLPENRAYWTYMGSLTTPPCSEGVLWMVLKQPVQLAAEQLAIFSRLYRNNARPVQAANGRLIKESR
ncbi:MAG: carbonic anhydrase family protein [Rhodocyclales bacterium]|nr:carbonic anhydrase family protein [Rhodocyclales bacterium]